MSLMVKETLSRLEKQRLRALCRKRNLDALQKWGKRKLVKRLARSYGDLASVLDDLRRPELIDVATAFASLIQTTADQARLHSTGKIGGVLPLDTDKLHDDARGACRATVISPYYACDVLKNLLDGCGEVRVLLNGLGGRRLGDQIEELTDLDQKLQTRTSALRSSWRFPEGFFTPSCTCSNSNSNPKPRSIAWIGSANATNAALGGQAYNEEILLRLAPAPPSLLAYAECAWTNGQTLKDSRPSIDSLTAFFRTGDLYYKPYSTLPMTLNPFVELLKALSPEEKSRLSVFESPYADKGTEIGAFNIQLVHKKSNDVDGNGEKSRSRIKIRPYAIETCYGYWVAAPFVEEVERKLETSSKTKDGRLRKLCKWLQGKGRKKTIKAYKDYLEAVRQIMDKYSIDLKKTSTDRDIFKSTKLIKNRIATMTKNLKQESGRKRLSHPFVSTYVPELWDDVVARQQFEDTFFESLAEQSCKHKKSKAAKRLLETIGIYCETTSEEIRKALEEKLTDPDWYNREFAHSDTED